MDNKSFWIANIGSESLRVSLVTSVNGQYQVTSVGPETLYQATNESFVAAIDQSLSESASSISLPESSEPNSIALIISPFWVGSDGKILVNKLKLFESMFNELSLHPMGFISYDDAIVEEANISEGFPASFIIVNIESTAMFVSLTYLGKVIERIRRPIVEYFDPLELESALLEFKTDSTLPPQIILLGDVNPNDLEKVKNFGWIGKKSIETFLHFPEIKTYTQIEITTIFTKAITSQFQPPVQDEQLPVEDIPLDIEETKSDLSEVNPDDLGFTEGDNFTIPEELPPEVIETVAEPTPKKPFKLNLPKISLPSFKFPAVNFLLYFVAILPLLILIPFIFTSAKISLYVNPYKYSKTLPIILDPEIETADIPKNIYPVTLTTTNKNNTATIPATGKKTVGQKAQGEVTIFNKQDKVQNLPKGTVLLDSQGRKFELLTSVQVASSSSDLTLGVINLGKTTAMAIATEIGTEYNASKDTNLNFKDFSSANLVAKVNSALSGGSKNEVSAVSTTDKTNIDAKLKSQAESSTDQPGVDSIYTTSKNARVDYNREIGEESEELTATIQTTIYNYSLSSSQKLLLLDNLLSSEEGYQNSSINPADFEIKVTPSKNSTDKLTGTISITGQSKPSIDLSKLSQEISGKMKSTAFAIIKNNYPRVYKFDINSNFPFLPLPFRLSNIRIEVK